MKIDERIEKYFDGELSEVEEDLLWEDMEQNANLMQQYDEYVKIIHLVSQIGEEEPAEITKLIRKHKNDVLFVYLTFFVFSIFLIISFFIWLNQTDSGETPNLKQAYEDNTKHYLFIGREVDSSIIKYQYDMTERLAVIASDSVIFYYTGHGSDGRTLSGKRIQPRSLVKVSLEEYSRLFKDKQEELDTLLKKSNDDNYVLSLISSDTVDDRNIETFLIHNNWIDSFLTKNQYLDTFNIDKLSYPVLTRLAVTRSNSESFFKGFSPLSIKDDYSSVESQEFEKIYLTDINGDGLNDIAIAGDIHFNIDSLSIKDDYFFMSRRGIMDKINLAVRLFSSY